MKTYSIVCLFYRKTLLFHECKQDIPTKNELYKINVINHSQVNVTYSVRWNSFVPTAPLTTRQKDHKEPRHEKTGFLPMRKKRRRSASQ